MTNPAATTTQVVHLDFISLAENVTESAIQDLIQEASGLNHLESVQLVGVIRAARDRGLKPTALDELRAKPNSVGIRSPLSRGGDISTSPPEALSTTRIPGSAPASEGAISAPSPNASSASTSASETPDSSPQSDFDLAFFFVLDSFTSLEPFGTHSAYIHFLQGKVARILKGFAGADVALTAPFPEPAAYAACLALMAPDQTYDWEVRAALESWAADASLDRPKPTPSGVGDDEARAKLASSGAGAALPSPATAIGLAIGERQRYRGCVLSFTSHESNPTRLTTRPFVSSLIAGSVQRL